MTMQRSRLHKCIVYIQQSFFLTAYFVSSLPEVIVQTQEVDVCGIQGCHDDKCYNYAFMGSVTAW
jgi:hypothetical protein